MFDKLNELTEKTMIPIGLVIIIASIVFWLGQLSEDSVAHGKDIRKLEEIYDHTIVSIDERLSHIEGQLDVSSNRSKK